jgi:hypothetical protein
MAKFERVDDLEAVVKCLRDIVEGTYPDECVGVPVWKIGELADRLELIERRRRHGLVAEGSR